MTAKQVIDACLSRKWSADHIVRSSGHCVKNLAKHFGIDESNLTYTEVKQAICDRINECIRAHTGDS